MAKITLKNLRHSYLPNPRARDDYALKRLNLEWDDGGAYALLGPSGCGKTTLLNIISGLLQPSDGQVLFDNEDVTSVPPDARHIAQVFQFPVVYDTMSVFDNLAFPLRNRGVAEDDIGARVKEVADMLELTELLDKRASGLTADGKQKISLGRGLVRSDVNVIMFDEPLTVIDPHLKWQLRSKLKELHQRTRTTMIYVTHDQTEALTFADKVVVMHDGQVVQIGTPKELFEAPQHTFVGHFIGSPGMNILPVTVKAGRVLLKDLPVDVAFSSSDGDEQGGRYELGIRPEFIKFSPDGYPVEIVKIADTGRYRVVDARLGGERLQFLIGEDIAVPASGAHVVFDPAQTRLYRDGWLIGPDDRDQGDIDEPREPGKHQERGNQPKTIHQPEAGE